MYVPRDEIYENKESGSKKIAVYYKDIAKSRALAAC
jgi:hypothetical protein